MTISKRILGILRDKNITQRTLAHTLNVQPSTVSTWFRTDSESIPSAYILPICELLGTTPEELLTGNKPTPPQPQEPTLTEMETQIIELLRSMNFENQIEILHYAVQEHKKQTASEAADGSGNRIIKMG